MTPEENVRENLYDLELGKDFLVKRMERKRQRERSCLQNISVVGGLYPECVKDSAVRKYNPTKTDGAEFGTDLLQNVQ